MNSKSLMQLWETWDVRAFVISSLLLQIFLIFSAPLRKRMSKWYVSVPVWLAYLFADAIAIYVVGLISKSQMEGPGRPVVATSADVMVFWAPFLLVHLGGPDTITAFSFEDNELWLRHSVALASQCVVLVYVFYLAFPENKLLLPAVMMFISGTIKYGERIRSLYLASSTGFRESLLTSPDPGPDYAKLMEELESKSKAGLPTEIAFLPVPKRMKKIGNPEEEKELTDLEVVQHAHGYFKTSKGLIADTIFSLREGRASRDFFLKRNSWEAFKIVEVELNFIYEILYTKAQVVQGMMGYLFRVTSFVLTCAALLLFYLEEHQELGYEEFDVLLSYVLLFGAIALDLIAFTMVLFSDWTAVALSEPDTPYSGTTKFLMFIKKTKIITILWKSLRVERTRWPRTGTHEKEEKKDTLKEVVRRRWSKTISQYNLIDCCLRPRPKIIKSVIGFVGLTKILDSIQNVATKDYEDNLRDLIFNDLKMRSDLAEDFDIARELYSARGDWILRLTGHTKLLHWIQEIDYDESLILWHIATDLLYSTEEEELRPSDSGKDFKGLSKILSDYMLYLLVMQTNLMSPVAGIGLIRYRDTCSETMRFFRRRQIIKKKNYFPQMSDFSKYICGGNNSKAESGNSGPPPDPESQERKEETWTRLHAFCCNSILSVRTSVHPVSIKGDRSKSLLFCASMLAQDLRDPDPHESRIGEEKDKWEIIFKVWLELLFYAAARCRASSHAAQLSKGGQLITLVWLLMTHFGFGNTFPISEGHGRAKLIDGK